ncbi:unnamed protein product [Paramecium octaurelia]|uniref:Uncharacterized protein n=1 Tax=Paramecium octaurelia TaxID=43137 RepID=A0A8S1XAS3_PAROT|nr:unnamed protein product [Paramecium octaurelia]
MITICKLYQQVKPRSSNQERKMVILFDTLRLLSEKALCYQKELQKQIKK